jgi:hypothetical protein
MDIHGLVFFKSIVNPVKDLSHEIGWRNIEVPDGHAVTCDGWSTIGKAFQNRFIISEEHALMIPLIRLHQIDHASDAAIQKPSHLLFHYFFPPVSGIIASQELSGNDPVAAGKWDFMHGHHLSQ